MLSVKHLRHTTANVVALVRLRVNMKHIFDCFNFGSCSRRQTANYRENRQQCDNNMVAKHENWSIEFAWLHS